MSPSAKDFRTTAPAESMADKLLLASLLWVISLMLLGLVNITGAASYDTLPAWLLLLQVSWGLAQVLGPLRLIYCL
jgi:hypothetical protein